MLIGLVVSIVYIVGVSVFSWKFPYFQSSWQPQTVLSFFYPLILCAIGIRYLPPIPNRIWNGISLIGKASYHIFLIPIIFFVSGLQLLFCDLSLQTSFNINVLLVSLINIVILIALGLLFYYTEPKISPIFNQGFSGAYNLYKNGLVFYNKTLGE